ncbi:MAG: hypothetical protein H7322_08105 [Ramlibacter sp.]|nr:hypothetical protein [Ramlibacter sp.]
MLAQHDIVLRLDAVDQLVSSFSPSPFARERLHREAEQFIVERAMAQRGALRIVISLPVIDATISHQVRAAVREHFAVRLKQEQTKLGDVRQLGWRTLIIGVVFLTITILLVQLMKRSLPPGNLLTVVEGGLTVLAWVALWKPGELLLYDWIPLRRDARQFSRLEQADIEFTGHAERLEEMPPAAH